MELQRVSGPLGDPFFDTLRARHPQLDIVVLPPEGPGSLAAQEPLEPDDAVQRGIEEIAYAERVWSEVADVSVTLDHRVGGGPGVARWESRATVRETRDGFRMLVRLAAVLADWGLERNEGEVAWLRAVSPGGREVAASYAEEAGIFLLHLRSATWPVTDAAWSVLRGEG